MRGCEPTRFTLRFGFVPLSIPLGRGRLPAGVRRDGAVVGGRILQGFVVVDRRAEAVAVVP